MIASVAFAYGLHRLHLMHNGDLNQVLGVSQPPGWLASWYAVPPRLLDAVKSAVWQSFFAFDVSNTYNSVLWTMEKEFYGSMFLSAFLGLLGHRASRVLVYPLILLADHLLHLQWLNAFVAGIALCDLFVNRSRIAPAQQVFSVVRLANFAPQSPARAAGLALVAAGAGAPNYQDVPYLILGTVAVALVLFSSWSQNILASRIPMFLGRISFGLYLIHFPIICSFACGFYLKTYMALGFGMSAALACVFTCILSVLMGYGMYLVADRPGVLLSRWFSQRVVSASGAAPPMRSGPVGT